ncbi:GNAT family N-acetyltransferase [candidate division KSB1 bacterium]|nr:GNAT family N-acetyltransferase [candidate division KSB1 bacterium]
MTVTRYYFREARTENDFQNIFALRYRIYCLENKWLPANDYPDNLEKDIYDEYSKHFIAESQQQVIIGSIRLILSDKLEPHQTLPICKHPNIKRQSLCMAQSAEISRLVVDRKVRWGDVSLGLYRIMYQYTMDNHIHYWYIAVDEYFLHILQKLGFPFQAIGSAGNYMGTTVPAMLSVKKGSIELLKNNMRFMDWFQDSPYTLKQNRLIPHFLRRT